MGNRAVIAFQSKPVTTEPARKLANALTSDLHPDLDPDGLGIYLHWNGGIESVQAFLDAAKKLDVREDSQYTPARLCQIIGNFFGGTNSLGIGLLRTLDCDNGDNGVYVVNSKLDIVKRVYGKGMKVPKSEQKKYEGVLNDTLAKNEPFFKKETA